MLSYYSDECQMVIFQFCHFFYFYQLTFYYKGKLSFFSLTIVLMSSILLSLLLSFVLVSNCYKFGQQKSFQVSSWFFLTYPDRSLRNSLHSITEQSKFIFDFVLLLFFLHNLSPVINHFSRDSYFLLRKVVTKTKIQASLVFIASGAPSTKRAGNILV